MNKREVRRFYEACKKKAQKDNLPDIAYAWRYGNFVCMTDGIVMVMCKAFDGLDIKEGSSVVTNAVDSLLSYDYEVCCNLPKIEEIPKDSIFIWDRIELNPIYVKKALRMTGATSMEHGGRYRAVHFVGNDIHVYVMPIAPRLCE